MPVYLFIVVNCGDPGTPVNGTRTVSTFSYPITVNYTCNNGFRLIGNRSLNCLDCGHWSGAPPTCQSKLHYQCEHILIYSAQSFYMQTSDNQFIYSFRIKFGFCLEN